MLKILYNILERRDTMLKTIPIGTEDFKKIIEDNFYYVDKTLGIEKLLN